MHFAGRWANVLRSRLEGILFLACIPPLLALRIMAGVGRGVRAFPGRWLVFLTRGLQELRERWWPSLSLEPPQLIWRYFLTLEVLDSLACRREVHRGDAGGDRLTRVLVIRLGHVGDILHTIPMVRALRRQLPKARIELLVGPWSRTLAESIPYVDEVHVFAPRLHKYDRGDASACRTWIGELGLFRRLRQRRYALCFSPAPNNLVDVIMEQGIRPDLWIGVEQGTSLYPSPGASRLVPFDSRRYEAEWVMSFLVAAGLNPEDPALEMPVRDADRQWADDLLSREAGDASRPLVAIAPGAGWAGKMWPEERYSMIGDWMIGGRGLNLVLLGGPGEVALGESIEARMKSKPVNLMGRTTLGQAAGVLSHCALIVCNDNGLLHVGAALGTATVALFGPTSAEKWAPKGDRHAVVQHQLDCPGCYPWHPRARCSRENACMRAIEVEEVKKAIDAMLERVDVASVE